MAGQMEAAERLPKSRAMLDAGSSHPQAFEEGDERRRPPGKFLQGTALAVVDGVLGKLA